MDLMSLLPPIYEKNSTMEELQSILSSDINSLVSAFNETIDQCFVNTATRSLSRYENIYGLQVDVSKSNEFRRERILAKFRGVGTTTKKMIIDTAAAFSNGEVEVIEDPSSNSFVIKFVGTKGIPANMDDLVLTIEEIKPAHLSYSFEYTYRRWSEVSGYLWGEVADKTWYQLSAE